MGVYNIFSNQFGIYGLPWTQIMPNELFRAISWICKYFFTVLNNFLKWMLQQLAVKLQKYFVYLQTSICMGVSR